MHVLCNSRVCRYVCETHTMGTCWTIVVLNGIGDENITAYMGELWGFGDVLFPMDW
jgi:hypothetical protein